MAMNERAALQLEDVAQERGYLIKRWGGKQWLTQQAGSIPKGEVEARALETIFPGPRVFERSSKLPLYQIRFLRTSSEFQFNVDALERHARGEKSYVNRDGRVRKEKILELLAMRDALERQVQREGDRLQRPLKEIRSILMVWLREAVGDELSSSKAEMEHSLGTLAWAWNLIATGCDATVLHRNLEGLADLYGPKDFAHAQISGVRRWLPDRDRILLESIPICRRFVLLESLVYSHVSKEPLPKIWRGMAAEDRNQHRAVEGLMGDVLARQLRPHIDRAENLSHACAIADAHCVGDAYKEEVVAERRRDENCRKRVTQRLEAMGYLPQGKQHSPVEKLEILKQRVISAVDDGEYPERPPR